MIPKAITLTVDQMREAVRYYLEKEVFACGDEFSVGDITRNGNGDFTLEIKPPAEDDA